MTNKLNNKTRIAITMLGAGMMVPGLSCAAGFALLEQSGSGMGNAFAGSAAVAEDVSTIFFNPAGLTLMPGPQVVGAAHLINFEAEFNGTGAITPPALPVGSNTGGDAGDVIGVPNLYFGMPVGERLAFGVGVNAPFGLTTEYDSAWVGRFMGIKSDLKTVNVNPSIAFKLNDVVSLGAGINWQKADAELTNAVVLPGPSEGRSVLEADDDTWGWNVGALFQLGQDMKVGISYRSTMDYELEGTATVTSNVTGATVASFPAKAEITFPDMAILSVVQRFGEKWELLGDLMYTHWSEIDRVAVVNSSNGATVDTLTFAFDDAWRVALGVNYHSSERWTFKGGLAYDQSPVEDNTRTVRLPDEDRVWLALGVKYRFSKNSAVDLGYAHLFIDDPSIAQSRTIAAGVTSSVNGTYDTAIDLLSLQLTWTF
jgi:long-chain fatty acid transport protein